jgi:hypothetical protein
MSEFSFPYYSVTNKVTIEDNLIKTQQGPLIKKEFSTCDLQYFAHSISKQYETLTFMYTDKNLKTKKIQIYCNPGAAPFEGLITELNNKFPKKYLNNMDKEEALKIIKSVKINMLVPMILVFVIMGIIACSISYPWLRHCFDKGFAEITVDKLIANPDIGTRNLKIEGNVLNTIIQETTTTTYKGSTTETIHTFFPLVGPDWKENDPVKVILELGNLSPSGIDELDKYNLFTGVIRDIWWEGLSSDKVDFFDKEYKIKLDKPILIEVTYKKRNDQEVLWVLGAIMGVVFIILLIAFIVVTRQQKKQLV